MADGGGNADRSKRSGCVEAIFVVPGTERQSEPRHCFQPDDVGRNKGVCPYALIGGECQESW